VKLERDTLKRQVTEEGLRGKSSKKDLFEGFLAEREYRVSCEGRTRYIVGWLSCPYIVYLYSVAVCAQTTYKYGKSTIRNKSYL
jgi:hypothetical protein